jgi:tripartite-type tricarboxylate transporter receptor subunit TctC
MMDKPRRMRIVIARAALAGLAVATLASPPAGAQDYPNRPITLVVPYAAGGGLDVLARTLAPRLTERLGKTVVIENRTGAGTVIGANSVAKAAPDGYTLMLGTSTPFAINVTLHRNLPYDPARDFAPVALIANAPFVLLTTPALPVRSVLELIAYAKERPGTLSYGSAGPGSPQHLSMELLKSMTGMNVLHVPYRGDNPALSDLVAGHIAMQFAEATPVGPLMRDGKVRALAVSSATRLATMLELPTVAEAGVGDFNLVSWQMIVAPAGTPREIVARLHSEIKNVLDLPEIKADYARTARISVDYPPVEELGAFMRAEIARLGKVVEQAGIARSE